MKSVLLSVLISMACLTGKAQKTTNFVEFQRSFLRVGETFKKLEDTLKKQFEAKGFTWPSKYIYIRSFKYDSQLEVWVKNAPKETYKLFKTYNVCAMAGTLGPKRLKGDYQVPEGFYYVNEFKPNSNYFLALGVNYPNASDNCLSDSLNPGGDIFIHGSCTTVGCIPIMNSQIEEVYTLAAFAKSAGLDYIPVHIFPIRFSNYRSKNYLALQTKNDQSYQAFALKLKEAYDMFERFKQPPLVFVNKKGEYIFQEVR
jgi:murein L,D-transpeptidase YafK